MVLSPKKNYRFLKHKLLAFQWYISWSNKICRQYSAGILINSLSDHFPVFFFENKKQTKQKISERITRNINKHTISSFCKILKTTKWTNVTIQKHQKWPLIPSLKLWMQQGTWHFQKLWQNQNLINFLIPHGWHQV